MSTQAALMLLLVATGCGTRSTTPTATPTPDQSPTAAGPPPTVATVDASPSVDPAITECLASAGLRAVVTLASSTPDCSGVGHDHLVFEVTATSGGAKLQRAYVSCPLGPCPELGGVNAKDGSVWVAVLKPDPRPARTVYCVAVPATGATVVCAVPVDSIDHGRRLIE